MTRNDMASSVHIAADIPTGTPGRTLPGELEIPRGARGVVVFAHGSGSGRLSSRNRLVAAGLQEAGLGTLLMDLLDEQEARDRHCVFDEELLADRLDAAMRWMDAQPAARSLPLGYFGASTGAAATLLAAAREPDRVSAVVSRGGRPDMVLSWLHLVHVPTLLIVGELDDLVLGWNQDAYRRIRAEKALVVVPGATHLFEERGALEEVTDHARRWFLRHPTKRLAIGTAARKDRPRPIGHRLTAVADRLIAVQERAAVSRCAH